MRYLPMRLLLLLCVATIGLSCAKEAPPDATKKDPAVAELNLTKPQNAARWEASSSNVFKSKIVVVNLTSLRGSLTGAGHQKREPVAVEVCGALSKGMNAEQRDALDLLVKNEAALYPKVRAAIYDFYKQSYEDYRKGWSLGTKLYGGGDISAVLPAIVEGNELDRLVTFRKILIHSPQNGTVSIGIECDCTWDKEHGLGVVISADGGVKAGLAEIAYPH